MKVNHTIEEQKARSRRFPPDRIPFLHNREVARIDAGILTDFRNGLIGIESACRRMAKNNLLDEVTQEQFLKLYRSLGYDRDFD